MALITCNDTEIYYEKAGRGPALVLIHGLGGDVRQWAPLAGKLENDFTLITFDMRGSGRSAKPKGPCTVKLLADDAVSLIEQLCGDAVSVLGFSIGGAVAMDLALRRPELVKDLTLASALPSWSGPFPPSDRVKALFRKTEVSRELLADVYDVIFGSQYKKKVSVEKYIDYRLTDEYPQSVSAYLNQLHALDTFDFTKNVSSIFAKTLVIAGDEDRVVPLQNAAWLKEKIPDAEMEIFHGVGHMVPVEAPDRLAMKILSRTH